MEVIKIIGHIRLDNRDWFQVVVCESMTFDLLPDEAEEIYKEWGKALDEFWRKANES